jgi:hypothetical protein
MIQKQQDNTLLDNHLFNNDREQSLLNQNPQWEISFWHSEEIRQYNFDTEQLKKGFGGMPLSFLGFMGGIGAIPVMMMIPFTIWLNNQTQPVYMKEWMGWYLVLSIFGGALLGAFLTGCFMPKKLLYVKAYRVFLENYEKAQKRTQACKEDLLAKMSDRQCRYEIILSLDVLRLNLMRKYGQNFMSGFYELDNIKNALIKCFNEDKNEEAFNILCNLPNLDKELSGQWVKYLVYKHAQDEENSFKKGYENYLQESQIGDDLKNSDLKMNL